MASMLVHLRLLADDRRAIFSSTASVRWSDAPGGSCVTRAGSPGRPRAGTRRAAATPAAPAATMIAPNTPSAIAERRIARRTVPVYCLVARAKPRLKAAKPRPSRPRGGSVSERGFKQQRAHRRREGQRDERRDQHRHRQRQRELLVELAGQAAEERHRHEHRGQHQRDRDHRARHVRHRRARGCARIEALAPPSSRSPPRPRRSHRRPRCRSRAPARTASAC